MSIKDQITADMKDAMRARDQLRLDTLRSVVSAFNYKRIEASRSSTRPSSSRSSSGSSSSAPTPSSSSRSRPYRSGRQGVAERDILLKLPARAEVARRDPRDRAGALAALPPEGRNQGALMKAVLPQLKGLADGNVVRQIVLDELASA